MKTIFKISAMVAMMFTTVVSSAKETKHSLVAVKDAKSFVFRMDVVQPEGTTVKLVDMHEAIIYDESVSGEGMYRKKFDLAGLEGGIYYLKIEDFQKVIEYTLKVGDKEVAVIKVDEDNKPIFKKKGDKVYVNLLNLNKKNVEIKVFDSNNRVVYSEEMSGKVLVEKAINFEQAVKDSYTVVVKHDNETYYEEVVVN